MTEIERADWQGVGASFRTLGNRLKKHAIDTGEAVRASGGKAESNVVDDVTSAFKAAFSKIDETTTDPQTAAAAKDATAKFLDAIKIELTGGNASADQGEPDASGADDQPPKAVED